MDSTANKLLKNGRRLFLRSVGCSVATYFTKKCLFQLRGKFKNSCRIDNKNVHSQISTNFRRSSSTFYEEDAILASRCYGSSERLMGVICLSVDRKNAVFKFLNVASFRCLFHFLPLKIFGDFKRKSFFYPRSNCATEYKKKKTSAKLHFRTRKTSSNCMKRR